jgi:Putative zinc-finger
MTCPVSTSLGAYLLGSLDSREREEIERHLVSCAECREEIIGLAPLPGMLSRIVPDELREPAERPPLAAVTAPVARRRRSLGRRRSLAAIATTAVVAAALAVTGTLAAGTLRSGRPEPAPGAQSAITLSGTDPRSHIVATAALTASSWGTGVQLQLRGVAPRQRCRLVVHAGDGRAETASTWSWTYADTVTIPGATSIAPPDIAGMDVVAADGHPLVHLGHVSAPTPAQPSYAPPS